MGYATVTGVTVGMVGQGPKGEYKFTEFKFKPDPYKGMDKPEKTKKIFMNAPVHGIVETLRPGERINVTYGPEPYYNVEQVDRLEGGGGGLP